MSGSEISGSADSPHARSRLMYGPLCSESDEVENRTFRQDIFTMRHFLFLFLSLLLLIVVVVYLSLVLLVPLFRFSFRFVCSFVIVFVFFSSH